MILIDAIYINNGGGKVLLDYLIRELEKTDLNIYYLIDDRINKTYTIKQANSINYINSGFFSRMFFYKKHSGKFSKILVLGNIPAPIKVKHAIVYTYFHNSILIDVPKEFTLLDKLKYALKVQILKMYSRNTNFWLLQSETLSNQFTNRFKQQNKISILPFYPSIKKPTEKILRKRNTFLYVSNAQSNKNHARLIEAFCKAYDTCGSGKLTVTVDKNFPNIVELINVAVDKGYPIENIGFVDRDVLAKKYMESEYVIFPSLTESFGLGLIEGVELECKIIAADLPYTYAVVNPTLVFDPRDVDSICNTICKAIDGDLQNSSLKVSNEIAGIIKALN